jgi:hypothetical protein
MAANLIGGHRLEPFADDIASLCQAVFGDRPLIFYGHSFGGPGGPRLGRAAPRSRPRGDHGDAPRSPTVRYLTGQDRAVFAG